MTYAVIENNLITQASIREIKIHWSKNGKQLIAQAAFNIEHNNYSRRCIWHKFFLHGATQESLQISSDLWYDMLNQIGIENMQDDLKVPDKSQSIYYTKLNNRKVTLRVKVKKGSNGFKDSNEVAAFV